jgi:hypothetical protein
MEGRLSGVYTWKGETYRVDAEAPSGDPGLRVKRGDEFVGEPGLGKLFASIVYEGELPKGSEASE